MTIAGVLREDYINRLLRPKPRLFIMVCDVPAYIDMVQRRLFSFISSIELHPVPAAASQFIIYNPDVVAVRWNYNAMDILVKIRINIAGVVDIVIPNHMVAAIRKNAANAIRRIPS